MPGIKNLSEKVAEVLKKSKRVSDEDIQKGLIILAKTQGGKLTDILVGMGVITEKEVASLLGDEINIPFLNLTKYKIDADVGKMIPEKLARKYQIVPISRIGNTLTLAVSDPFNILAIDDIATFTRRKIDCVISTQKSIEAAIEELYSAKAESLEEMAARVGVVTDYMEAESGDEGAKDSASGAPIVKLLDSLFMEALNRRASDIHIEPFEKDVRVRYRVDGHLEEATAIPKRSQNAVLSRIKILTKLDITESRVPQDGRFRIKFQNREVDFRVSILPVYFGGKAVIRILDKGAMNMGLDKLGFHPAALETLRNAIVKPFGMVLVTGPTGSGKSTTLNSILSELNTPEKNIVTIEDPIEYQLKGVTQIQTKTEIGFDFASGLRAILRQSPDIVMVGEIRDSETADIAVKASLTGQLVLSTLHTNDAAGAVTRLVDMEIEPFLIASSVIIVMAQRLCRSLCPSCKEEVEVPKEALKSLMSSMERVLSTAPKTFYHGRGCGKCNRSGYRGRVAIHEALVIDDALRDMIVKKRSSFEIKDYATKHGMLTLREDAIRKCCEGVTSLEEILRVTSEDE